MDAHLILSAIQFLTLLIFLGVGSYVTFLVHHGKIWMKVVFLMLYLLFAVSCILGSTGPTIGAILLILFAAGSGYIWWMHHRVRAWALP